VIVRFLLWLSRLWHDYQDLKTPRITLRDEWTHETRHDR